MESRDLLRLAGDIPEAVKATLAQRKLRHRTRRDARAAILEALALTPEDILADLDYGRDDEIE